MSVTFASFIPHAQARRAHAAAVAAAEHPGPAHNPLFLHGPAGAGKSHLLCAIAHAIRARQPQANIVRLSAETFMARILDAIRHDCMDEIRRELDAADALLLDDFAPLDDKPASQGELCHHLQAVVTRGGQVVVTSHVALANMRVVAPRLREFFESGLIAEIGYPDIEARIEIARNSAAARGLTLSNETLRRIAENSAGDPRALQSTIARTAFLAT